MELFINQLINALNLGSIYALVAIGYSKVYGIIRLINFAHGEIMMFGAYFAFIFAFSLPFQLPFLLIVLLSMLSAGIIGILIERVAYRKLRNAPRISALITAIGVSLFLQNLARLIFGTSPYVMSPIISTEPIRIGVFSISRLTVLTVVLSIIAMVLLSLFVKNTKQGKAMRAVSEDREAASLMGIHINRVISITFFIGSALGALGGVFYAMAFTQIQSSLGIMPGLKAFIAAVFGGIGNITGAMIGGYVIGIIETMTKAYISSKWVDAIVFGLLIFILLFKPTGLFGKNEKEKV